MPESEPVIVGVVGQVGTMPNSERPTIRVDREPEAGCGTIFRDVNDPIALVVRRLPDGSLDRIDWTDVEVGDSVRAWGRRFFHDSCPGKTALAVLEVIE